MLPPIAGAISVTSRPRYHTFVYWRCTLLLYLHLLRKRSSSKHYSMTGSNNMDALFTRAGGLYPPPSVISSWPRPNHVNPETRGWAVPIVLMVFLTLTFIVYAARMWARLIHAKNAGLDDLLISMAMIFVVGSTIAVILGKTCFFENPDY